MNRVFALVATAAYANALALTTETSASASRDVCHQYLAADGRDTNIPGTYSAYR